MKAHSQVRSLHCGVARWLSTPPFLLLLVMLPSLAGAQFNYTTNNGTITIIGYTGPGGNVTIPETINGLSVTVIGDSAFENQDGLTGITIPNTVIDIGAGAFSDCSFLTNATIPGSVSSIGSKAFYACWSLRVIEVDSSNSAFSSLDGVLFDKDQTTLIQCPGLKGGDYSVPNTVTNIGSYAFASCSWLTSITVPDSVSTIGKNGFSACTGLADIDIGNGVVNVGDYSFDYCTSLPSVIIPNSVTNLGNDVFDNCQSLTNVWVGDHVANIGAYAFVGCTVLEGVYFAGNAPSLGSQAFAFDNVATVYYMLGKLGWGGSYGGRPTATWNPFLYTTEAGQVTVRGYTGPWDEINIPSTIENLPVTTIGNDAFFEHTNLTSVVVPNSVLGIESNAFSGCTSLTSITIGDGVISIGDKAFYNCTGLIEVSIPISVKTIGEWAFEYCTGLTNAALGTGITNISGGAFYHCIGLTDVVIPDGVIDIGFAAFADCSGLIYLTLGNSLISIGDWAFEYCTALTSVSIPSSVTTLGEGAFSDCTSLITINVDPSNTSYVSFDGVLFNKGQTMLLQCPGGKGGSYAIPDTVASIESAAFSSCASLTSITIGNSVTTIGDWAFYYCTNLTAVLIPDSVTSIAEGAFEECAGLINITLGARVSSIGAYAFSSCTSLKSVGIPDGVTGIEEGTFDSCYNLTSVTIPAGVISIDDYAFYDCTNLASVYFTGDAPSLGSYVFDGLGNLTVYCMPVTTGWGPTFAGYPTELWLPEMRSTNIRYDLLDNNILVDVATTPTHQFWLTESGDLTNWSRNTFVDHSRTVVVGPPASGSHFFRLKPLYGQLSWFKTNDMPVARDSFTGGVIDGKLYVFGGNGNPDSLNLNRLDIYDLNTGQWTWGADYDLGIEEVSSAVVGGKLYVFGGWAGFSANVNICYDPQSNSWSEKAPKPTQISGAPTVAWGSEILVVGGDLDDGTPATAIEAYNTLFDTWRVVTDLPDPVALRMGETFGGEIEFPEGPTSFADQVIGYSPGSHVKPPYTTPESALRVPESSGALESRAVSLGDYVQPNQSLSTNFCMAASWRSMDSTSLNWVRQRSRLCPGRCVRK